MFSMWRFCDVLSPVTQTFVQVTVLLPEGQFRQQNIDIFILILYFVSWYKSNHVIITGFTLKKILIIVVVVVVFHVV